MSRIRTEAFELDLPSGNIYARKWIPDKVLSEIPVVLLHDSLGSVDLWREFPEILSQELSRTVIAYDRSGFGNSDARVELPSLEFIKEEATDYFPIVKSRLAVTEYILFGHSVGGAMAINIAARDPDCCAVVTAASQAFVEELTVRGIQDAIRLFAQPGQIERLEKWHGRKAGWVLRAWADVWLSPECSTWSLKDCIRGVVCPVLAIHGDNDQYGSIAFPEFIAGKVAGVSEMLILKNCGHMPHKEKTDEVINAVKVFLNAHNL